MPAVGLHFILFLILVIMLIVLPCVMASSFINQIIPEDTRTLFWTMLFVLICAGIMLGAMRQLNMNFEDLYSIVIDFVLRMRDAKNK